MNPTRRAASFTDRLHAAGIPAECVYSATYHYAVGMRGTHGATVLQDCAPGSTIPYFVAQRMTARECHVFVSGLCLSARVCSPKGV